MTGIEELRAYVKDFNLNLENSEYGIEDARKKIIERFLNELNKDNEVVASKKDENLKDETKENESVTNINSEELEKTFNEQFELECSNELTGEFQRALEIEYSKGLEDEFEKEFKLMLEKEAQKEMQTEEQKETQEEIEETQTTDGDSEIEFQVNIDDNIKEEILLENKKNVYQFSKEEQEKIDAIYMQRALELAIQGMGAVTPNPMVGCVVVKEGRIIGEGYHEKCGEWHAERNALNNLTQDAQGATLYVTLEPCCHHGKTPPCTDIIIEKKIKRVVVGCVDDNPLVDNKGIRILEEQGIEVSVGILEDECRKINEVFFHYIKTKKPFMVMKYAMTLDGKIAAYTGDSKWITGEYARSHVHMLRNKYTAILVGVGTVLADDPMLNCRISNMNHDINMPYTVEVTSDGIKTHNPIRIICDTELRIPLDSSIVKSAKKIRTIVVCGNDSNDCSSMYIDDIEICKSALKDIRYARKDRMAEKMNKLIENGVEIISVSLNEENRIDMNELIAKLGKMQIDSVLVEGGHTIHGELLKIGAIDRVYAYIAPKIIGGEAAPGPIGGKGKQLMRDALELTDMEVLNFDKDVVITGKVKTQEWLYNKN